MHIVHSDVGLAIYPVKTEVLYQWHAQPPSFHTITIDSTPLEVKNRFVYYGAILHSDYNTRISEGLAAFARIRDKVVKNHSLRLRTKISVYRAICFSVRLYGSETMTLYARQLKLLKHTHIRYLNEILGISRRDRIPNF